MELETVWTCPLGSKCTEIKDNKIHKCMWYQKMQGVNPQTGEPVDTENCAIIWHNILLIENSAQQRSTSAAVESFRNETVQGQSMMNSILAAGVQNKLTHYQE